MHGWESGEHLLKRKFWDSLKDLLLRVLPHDEAPPCRTWKHGLMLLKIMSSLVDPVQNSSEGGGVGQVAEGGGVW